MLLEVQCEVSTVSDDLGCHVLYWCWSTVFSEVQAKRCVCSNKSCVRSFAGCADLNLAGRAVEEGLVSQVQ